MNVSLRKAQTMKNHLNTAFAAAAFAVLAATTAPAFAADTTPMSAPEPAAAKPAPLASAQAFIADKKWAQALTELKRVNQSGNADWNNLMGYALRKQAQPDLEGAQRHYDAALRLDPKHQGALEYAGELALMKSDLPAAEAYLARLTKLCSSPCEPLDDLKKAVAAYKAKGGKPG
jgi:tetratricopeptide (TPR) repeat protein